MFWRTFLCTHASEGVGRTSRRIQQGFKRRPIAAPHSPPPHPPPPTPALVDGFGLGGMEWWEVVARVCLPLRCCALAGCCTRSAAPVCATTRVTLLHTYTIPILYGIYYKTYTHKHCRSPFVSCVCVVYRVCVSCGARVARSLEVRYFYII